MHLMSLATLIFTALVDSTSGKSNGSREHAIRNMLLNNYDKNVRPIPPTNTSAVIVEFGLKINRLIELDNKEQIITIDSWVIMKWNNSFLAWKKEEFSGMDRVQFLPEEVWFPDIVLYNNGDSSTPVAGGRSKFLSNVAVEYTGLNVWSGPATFTANCDLVLNKWPFDEQTCEFRFGSFSYNSHLLKISSFGTKHHKSENFIKNANWELNSPLIVKVQETSFGNCCPYNFSEISHTITITRRFQYYMFYLVAPCLVLSFLTLVSFWIPSESGERIGFVTTLLLGMTVFLLVVPASLPESSVSIPVLGILMMGTMIMITFALLATILVLRFFHATGRPPKFLRRLFKPSKRLEPEPIRVTEAPDQGNKSDVSLSAVHPVHKEQAHSETSPVKFLDEDYSGEITWQMVAQKLDAFFFWLFLISSVAINSVLLTSR